MYVEEKYSYSIKENGGVYYCAKEGSHEQGCCMSCDDGERGLGDFNTYTYLSSSKYRHEHTDDLDETETTYYCSDTGDPKNGSEEEC